MGIIDQKLELVRLQSLSSNRKTSVEDEEEKKRRERKERVRKFMRGKDDKSSVPDIFSRPSSKVGEREKTLAEEGFKTKKGGKLSFSGVFRGAKEFVQDVGKYVNPYGTDVIKEVPGAIKDIGGSLEKSREKVSEFMGLPSKEETEEYKKLSFKKQEEGGLTNKEKDRYINLSEKEIRRLSDAAMGFTESLGSKVGILKKFAKAKDINEVFSIADANKMNLNMENMKSLVKAKSIKETEEIVGNALDKQVLATGTEKIAEKPTPTKPVKLVEKPKEVPVKKEVVKKASEVKEIPKVGETPKKPYIEPKPFEFDKVPTGKKKRGFVKSIESSPEVNWDLGTKLAKKPEAYYGIRKNKPAVEKAQKLILTDINVAEKVATTEATDDAIFTAAELTKEYTSLAQKAKRAGNMAEFETAMDKAVNVSLESAKTLTEAGRTVQAASTISRLSPDGIIRLVNKTIKKVGGKDVQLSNEQYLKIIKQAEDVAGTLDPKQRALKSFQLLDDIYAFAPSTTKDKVFESINIPRAIMATADVSAGFRQGIFYATKHPIKFSKSFIRQFKYLVSEKAYRNFKADVVTDPDYAQMVKHKLPLTDMKHGLGSREEAFLSSWIEKIPGLGHITRASNRAYTGLLNELRVDYFKDFVKKGKILGITDPKYLDDAAKYVGNATGRGNLYNLEPIAVELTAGIFSPRLAASRIQLLNPVYYKNLSPEVRKEALKSLFAFTGIVTGMLSLAKMSGAEVGTNPYSSDFGKIKVGKTRVDIMGGFQQYIRMAAQIVSGKYISSTTGVQMTLGEGYKPMTRWDIFQRQLESKASPIASFIQTAARGQDYKGRDVDYKKELASRFTPMVVQDIVELAKEEPELLPLSALGAVGFGIQTYATPEWEEATTSEKYQIAKEMKPREAKKKVAILRRKNPQAAANIDRYEKWDKYKLTGKEKGFFYLGVQSGDRAEAIFKHVRKMNKKEADDTLIRLRKADVMSKDVILQVRKLTKESK